MIAAFLLLTVPLPVPAQAQTPASVRQGTLQGTVYSEGMKSRVANAVVKLRNLNTQREYASQPSDAKGGYKILMIEEGWYTLGLTTASGDFNLNYGVYIKSGETAKLSVEMMPGGMLEGKSGNSGGKKGFFSKPGGILVLVAAVGAAGFGIYELTKNEEEVSPDR
jgi:hypothetical protein